MNIQAESQPSRKSVGDEFQLRRSEKLQFCFAVTRTAAKMQMKAKFAQESWSETACAPLLRWDGQISRFAPPERLRIRNSNKITA